MARIANFTSSSTPTGPRNTLAELMTRKKILAQQQGDIMAPRPIESWTQGAAQLAQSLVNGLQQRRAAAEEASGRDRMAAAMAGIDWTKGGPSPDQMQTIAQFDPAAGQRMMEQQAQRAMEELKYRRGVERSDFEWGRTQEDQIADEARQAAAARAVTGETRAYETGSEIEKEKRAAAAKAAEPLTPEGKLKAELDAGRITQEVYDAAIKKETAQAGVGGPQQLKVLYDQQDQYINTSSAIGQLDRAKTLLDQGINTGYTAGLRTMYGAAGGPGGDEEAAKRTKEYNSIMNQEAITAMLQALKGSTTDTEMAEFIKNMNDPTLDPAVKSRQIDRMLANARAHNEQQAARIKEMNPNAELPRLPAAVQPDEEGRLLQGARDAIAKGADAALVKKRLVDKGIDPGKL